MLLASFHMEGKALIWFEDLEVFSGITSREAFIRGIQTRFVPTAYKDPMKALTKL